MTPKDIQRFWDHVNKAGPSPKHIPKLGRCWVWSSYKPGGIYGKFYYKKNGKNFFISAHRASYLINNGKIKPGLCVLHHCDNKGCVNPNHLFLGTFGDNNSDRAAKGRSATGAKNGMNTHPENRKYGDENPSRKFPERLKRGSKNTMAKLTESKVRKMRELYAEKGHTLKSLGIKFGIHFSVVWDIVNFKGWRHVT